MNQRDRELLDKQFSWLIPPPRHNTIILTVVAAFVAGLTLGGSLFARESNSVRIAARNAAVEMSASHDMPLRSMQARLSD